MPPSLVSRSPTASEISIRTPLVFQFNEPLRPLRSGDLTVTQPDGGVVAAAAELSTDATTLTVRPEVTPPLEVSVAFPGVRDIAGNTTAQVPLPFRYPVWVATAPPFDAKPWYSASAIDSEGRAVVVSLTQGVVVVRRYDGTSWQTLGDLSGIESADAPVAIAARGSEVVFISGESQPDATNILRARRWTGSSWELMGTTVIQEYFGVGAISLDSTLRPTVALPSGGRRILVLRWTGTAWESLENITTAADTRYYLATIAFDAEDRPIVAYPDLDASDSPTVSVAQWTGAAWSKLGDSLPAYGPSASNPPNLLLDEEGTLLLLRQLRQGLELNRWTGTAWSTTEVLASGDDELTTAVLGLIPGEGLYAAWWIAFSNEFHLTRETAVGWTELPYGVVSNELHPLERFEVMGGRPGEVIWVAGEGTEPQLSFYNR